MVSNLTILEGIFETKFQGWFFFVPNNFYVDFFCKIEGEFNFLVNFFFGPIQFLRDFFCKIEADFFFVGIVPNEIKGISFMKLKAVTNFVGNGGKSFYSSTWVGGR